MVDESSISSKVYNNYNICIYFMLYAAKWTIIPTPLFGKLVFIFSSSISFEYYNIILCPREYFRTRPMHDVGHRAMEREFYDGFIIMHYSRRDALNTQMRSFAAARGLIVL